MAEYYNSAYYEIESLTCRIYPDEIGKSLTAVQVAKIARRKVFTTDGSGTAYWCITRFTLAEALEEFNNIKAVNKYDENEDAFICTVAVLTYDNNTADFKMSVRSDYLTAVRLKKERRAVEEKYKALTA